MNTTWRLSSYESMTDVKELIPEFFYLPEFLINREGKLSVWLLSGQQIMAHFKCPALLSQALILGSAKTEKG